MIHILLVDDEPLVLVGIQSMLKWEDYDAEIIGTARNGAQALEFIEKQKPDLIISDIKMPVMDGLQLLETVREKYGKLPLFIMLTSFEEYSYVKKAIHLQAVDYLVKLDIDERSMIQALNKAKEQLSAARTAEAEAIRRPRAERTGMQVFYDRFFVRLFNGLFESEEQYRNQRKELGVDLDYEAFAVCYCELMDFSTQHMLQEKLMSLYAGTTHIVWDTVTRFLPCYVTSLDSCHFNITFCLTEAEAPIHEKVLREILEKTTQLVYNYFSVQMRCSLGCKVSSPTELNRSYYTARRIHTEHSGKDASIVIYSPDRAGAASGVFDFGSYREPLLRAFSDQDAGALEEIIGTMTQALLRHPARPLQAMDAASNLLYLCISQLNEGDAIVGQIFENDPDGYRCVYRVHTVSEITRWMQRLGSGIADVMRDKKRAYRDKAIIQIKEYICSNLNKRLTLTDVADAFGFSPNYLSQLFARQNDCSFVEYITREKIRAAKEMLLSDDSKIYQVSERLGFENAFYFSKVFKKIEGCSPREYLQKQKGV